MKWPTCDKSITMFIRHGLPQKQNEASRFVPFVPNWCALWLIDFTTEFYAASPEE